MAIILLIVEADRSPQNPADSESTTALVLGPKRKSVDMPSFLVELQQYIVLMLLSFKEIMSNLAWAVFTKFIIVFMIVVNPATHPFHLSQSYQSRQYHHHQGQTLQILKPRTAPHLALSQPKTVVSFIHQTAPTSGPGWLRLRCRTSHQAIQYP